MALIDSWAEPSAIGTSSSTSTLTVPRDIAAGSLVVLAIGRTGGTTVASVTSPGTGNDWTVELASPNATSTVNVAIARCRLTTGLAAGATITVNGTGTSQRWAFACGVFDGVDDPSTRTASVPGTTTGSLVSATPPTLASAAVLNVAAVASASSAFPVTGAGGSTLVGQAVTSIGSAERGVALAFRYTTSDSGAVAMTLSNGVSAVSGAVGYEAAAPPAPDIPVTVWNGTAEVPVTASVWNGAAEVPLATASPSA